MAGSLSDAYENKVLDHICGKTALSMPTPYVALTTTTPTDASAGTEVTGGSYARQAVTFGTSAASGSISNTVQVNFPQASADWGTVTHWELWDAQTNGTRILWCSLPVSKAILNGDTASFAIGALTVTMD